MLRISYIIIFILVTRKVKAHVIPVIITVDSKDEVETKHDKAAESTHGLADGQLYTISKYTGKEEKKPQIQTPQKKKIGIRKLVKTHYPKNMLKLKRQHGLESRKEPINPYSKQIYHELVFSREKYAKV